LLRELKKKERRPLAQKINLSKNIFPLGTDSSTSSVKGIPTTKGIPTAEGETKEPTEPAIAPDKTRQALSSPSVENKGLWGVVSGTVVLLVVAVPIAIAVAIYKRKRHGTAAGERLNNQQRRPLMASGEFYILPPPNLHPVSHHWANG